MPNDDLRRQVNAEFTIQKEQLPPRAVQQANQVETWIRHFNVKYSRLHMLLIDKIDERASRSNQARAEAIVPESVERYTNTLKKHPDEEFPPIVVFPVGKAGATRAKIIDGNNREAAYRKAGRVKIPAFFIDPTTPSEIIQLMTVSANAHHGVTPDLQWRLMQAQHLNSIGHSREVACEAANVTVNQLANYTQSVKADQRAKAVRVMGFADLASGSKVKLGAIPSDPVFFQAATVAVKTGMKLDDVSQLARVLRTLKSEGEQIAFVGEVAKQREMEERQRKAMGRRTPIKSEKNSLLSALGKIMATDPASISRNTLTDIERQEIIRRCDEATTRIMAIQEALELAKAREASDAG